MKKRDFLPRLVLAVWLTLVPLFPADATTPFRVKDNGSQAAKTACVAAVQFSCEASVSAVVSALAIAGAMDRNWRWFWTTW
jgi:hypothetical protein